ncbi:MAG TPA: hypothetical protein PKM88_00710 [bacterium]|nr:hypothetical protein [bacterium]
MLTIRLIPALLADVQAFALESGMEMGEWAPRVLRIAIVAADAYALEQVAS